MIMKQFMLTEYEKNPDRKIVTRDGKDVRILCTNRVVDYSDYRPIVALISQKGKADLVKLYYYNGVCVSDDLQDENDLFFAPEKHIGWINIYKTAVGYGNSIIYESKEEASQDKSLNLLDTIKVEWED